MKKIKMIKMEVELEYSPRWVPNVCYIKDIDGKATTTYYKEDATTFTSIEDAEDYIDSHNIHNWEDRYDSSRNLNNDWADTESYIREGSIKIVS